MKYAWIDAHRTAFVLAEACSVLDVSVSGYRAWKRGGTPERKRLTDAQLLVLIRAIPRWRQNHAGATRASCADCRRRA
jgi:putative transposase